MERNALERWLFASRWLLAPFYLALIAALAALLIRAGLSAYALLAQITTLSESDVVLGALGLVDFTLTAALVVLVVFSTYANFITRVEPHDHPDWPSWMVGIDFSELKLKLIASIVAIAAIKLLEAHMNVEHVSSRDLAWETGVFGAFVVAALVLAISERLSHGGGDSH